MRKCQVSLVAFLFLYLSRFSSLASLSQRRNLFGRLSQPGPGTRPQSPLAHREERRTAVTARCLVHQFSIGLAHEQPEMDRSLFVLDRQLLTQPRSVIMLRDEGPSKQGPGDTESELGANLASVGIYPTKLKL